MLKLGHKIACFSLITIGLISCKEDQTKPEPAEPKSELKVTVQPVFGAVDLELDSTYTTSAGHDIQFVNLKFFIENIQTPSGSIKDAALFDYRETGTSLFQAEGKTADATSLTANLGVGATNNHADPSAFPVESALNILNSGGMHWSWNPGYIFMKVEARVDTIPDGVPLFDHNVIFHIGRDVNLQSLSFSSLNWQQETDLISMVPLKLDMVTFLDNGTQSIDLKTEYTSHSSAGQEVLSLKVIENFRDALSTY